MKDEFRCKFEWEKIFESKASNKKFMNFRARVIGGWLVKDIYFDEDKDVYSSTVTFVPDPHHRWEIIKD
jgi:hypothetical protein